MKTQLLTLFIVLNVTVANSQTVALNTGLQSLAKQVASSINDSTIVKVAVWDFTDLSGAITTLGKYISEETTINLVNVGMGYDVMNRNHLAQIMQEHKLKSDGLIDNATAKQLGKLAAVDAIVIGSVTVLNEKIEITMQVLETETAKTIAAGKVSCIMDADVKLLLGMTTYDNSGQKTAKDPNLTAGVNEVYNDDKLMPKDCNTRKIGDYCFYNTTKYNLLLYISGDGVYYESKNFVNTGESVCFYSIPVGRFTYKIIYVPSNPGFSEWPTRGMPSTGADSSYKLYKQGAFISEQCKSKTFTVK